MAALKLVLFPFPWLEDQTVPLSISFFPTYFRKTPSSFVIMLMRRLLISVVSLGILSRSVGSLSSSCFALPLGARFKEILCICMVEKNIFLLESVLTGKGNCRFTIHGIKLTRIRKFNVLAYLSKVDGIFSLTFRRPQSTCDK